MAVKTVSNACTNECEMYASGKCAILRRYQGCAYGARLVNTGAKERAEMKKE